MNDQVFGNVTTLPVSQLKPGQFQPRSVFDDEKLMSLIDSIREKGIIQPLVVRKLDLGRYEIIAGERRWRAAKTLNYVEVPVIIRECNDTEALELAIVENIQRDDLNPLEEAEAYQKLMTQFSYTQEHIAKQIGKSRSYVANMLRLNGLPGNIKSLIFEGKISAGHARALLTIENNDELVQEIVAKNMNVREVERKVKELKGGAKTSDNTRIPQEKSDDIVSLENQLRGLLDSNVDIILKKDKGHITIHFNSLEQMDDIIQKIRSAMEGDH
jgi:ParB family chromosome partitioning protein